MGVSARYGDRDRRMFLEGKPMLLIVTQPLQVLDRRLALKIKYDTDRWLKKILPGNNACLHIVDCTSLQFEILSRSRIRGSG